MTPPEIPDINLEDNKGIENIIKHIKNKCKRIFAQENITIENRMLIGVFPTTRMEMYEDIDPKEFAENKLIQQLFEENNNNTHETINDAEPEKEELYEKQRFTYIQKLDPSQRRAANSVLNRNNLVIEVRQEQENLKLSQRLFCNQSCKAIKYFL